LGSAVRVMPLLVDALPPCCLGGYFATMASPLVLAAKRWYISPLQV
jgi:hypothetical protein